MIVFSKLIFIFAEYNHTLYVQFDQMSICAKIYQYGLASMKYFKWCWRPGSSLQVRGTLHCLHLFAIILVSLLVQSWHDGHVIHHILLISNRFASSVSRNILHGFASPVIFIDASTVWLAPSAIHCHFPRCNRWTQGMEPQLPGCHGGSQRLLWVSWTAIKSPVSTSAVKHWWNPLKEFGGLGTLTTWLRRWWSGLRGYSRSLAAGSALLWTCVCSKAGELYATTVGYTVQRSGAHRDSLEQFGQQLSLWLLLASLSDPCHNSVTSSQSKFLILFLLSIGKSNSISFNVVINDASYFLHTSAPIEIRTRPHWETLCLWSLATKLGYSPQCWMSAKSQMSCNLLYISHSLHFISYTQQFLCW